MTKSPRKNVPDVGIELGAACMPSELASDRATAPGKLIRDLGTLFKVISGIQDNGGRFPEPHEL